jgi:hypothetical protein
MPRYVLAGAITLLLPLLTFSGGLVAAKRQPSNAKPAPTAPVTGHYACHVLSIGGSIATPYGAAPTLTVLPSALISMDFDGSGSYRHSSGTGGFHYEGGTGKVIFHSGPFEGWPARSEADEDSRWVRFGAKKDAVLEPTSRLGDHICVLQK